MVKMFDKEGEKEFLLITTILSNMLFSGVVNYVQPIKKSKEDKSFIHKAMLVDIFLTALLSSNVDIDTVMEIKELIDERLFVGLEPPSYIG